MNKRKEGPKITNELLRLYDKKTLDLIKTTYYRRGSDGCNLTFSQYVKVLFDLNFVPGQRIIRKNTKLPWKKDNIMLKNDPIHKKMVDIDTFLRIRGYPKAKKIIIKMKDHQNERGALDGE